MKIIYTRGNREETLASLGTLRKVLNRFVRRHVFYEISSRSQRGHEFFSAKDTFTVGAIEVSNREHLQILIFDARKSDRSIEIINPQAMRIYDESPGRNFAISFLSEHGEFETRVYLREEGADENLPPEGHALESISLPQLFDYIRDITAVEPATKN
ncbi:MAG TPA: hypothetical protein VMV73_05495 [Candidatus Dormibacteraeota bacterium]|nr:hypothetical protein [Candidatus Dormibacteraeota bacterium]